MKLDEQYRQNCPSLSYDEVYPGLFRTYPNEDIYGEGLGDFDYDVRSKRHAVAKLKRAKRKHGKRTHLQNN